MQQKTADELFRRQDHCLFLVIIGPIQVSKSDTVFVNVLNPVIGDGNLMGISCQVLDDRIRIFERLFSMHYPIGFVELFLQLPEVLMLFQMTDLSSQGQLFSFVKFNELLKHLTPEGLSQCCDMKQEITFAFGAFPFSIIIQTSCRNNTMDMGMIKQCLCPGVQYGNHTHPGHKRLFGVPGKIIQRLPCTAEQQVVDQSLILIADGSKLRRQCEYHMKILYIQKVIFTFQYPFFLIDSLALWAMAISTRVVMYFYISTGSQHTCHMTTQCT